MNHKYYLRWIFPFHNQALTFKYLAFNKTEEHFLSDKRCPVSFYSNAWTWRETNVVFIFGIFHLFTTVYEYLKQITDWWNIKRSIINLHKLGTSVIWYLVHKLFVKQILREHFCTNFRFLNVNMCLMIAWMSMNTSL